MDLNIVIEESPTRDKDAVILDKIKTAIKLGYRHIAFNVCINENQIADLSKPPEIKVKKIPGVPDLSVLSRVTVELEDVGKIHRLNQSAVVKQYDLLSIEPTSEKVLAQLCGGHLDCDIITFSMDTRTKVNIKKANFTLPQSRGVCFEVNYRQLLLDSTSRQNVIAAGYLLCNKTRGKNILLSSGARSAIELRGAADVANLGLLFDLEEHKAKSAVYRNGHLALKHSAVRKNPTSHAVQISLDTSVATWLKKELCEPEAENKELDVKEPPSKRSKC